MNKQTLFFIIFLGFVAMLLGYNYFARPFEKIAERFTSPQIAEDFSVAEELSQEEKILSQLTAEEKLAQLISLPVNLDKESATSSAWITKNNPGFITIFGSNISKQEFINFKSKIHPSTSLGTRSQKLEIMLAVDHEGGSVQRLNGEGFTKLPSWQQLCQIKNQEERLSLLASSSAELSSAGIDIIFAPIIDIGNNQILKSRICSDNPELITEIATEFVSVFNNQNILPVLKHFPGIGKTSKDLHLQFDSVAVEEDSALIYKSLLDQFSYLGVMVSHVGVKNQYPDIPCSLSRSCVEELSNNYPENIIFSDALEMKSALYNKNAEQLKTLEQVSIEAIDAGINILVFGQEVQAEKFNMILNTLLEEYESNKNFEEKVNKFVLKIIKYKTKN